MQSIGNSWDKILAEEAEKPYFATLVDKVEAEYSKYEVYPPKDRLFAALQYVDFDDVKVVIIGQDPYHDVGQANGIAFAVSKGVAMPPSLVNIYKELSDDLGVPMPHGTTLEGWAKQGVLLLNTVLSVRAHKPLSHNSFGWQTFTDSIITLLSARERPVVFILWGANAIAKRKLIAGHHHIITSPHPSPLSAFRGFFGSKPFSKTNRFLESIGQSPIIWTDVDGETPMDYYATSGNIQKV